MKVQLCKTNLLRHGEAGTRALLEACERAGAEVARLDCLQRCQLCERACIALVDGAFAGARTAEELAAQLSALVEA